MNKKISVMIMCVLLFAPFATLSIPVFADSPETVEVSASVSCEVGTYSGTINVTVSLDGTMVTVMFDPALPNEDACTISLSGDIEESFCVRTLEGDVDFDGEVTIIDKNRVFEHYGELTTIENFWYDVTTIAGIGADDMGTVESRLGNTAPNCSIQPEKIVAARSIRDHDGTEYDLDIFTDNVEPRLDGVTKIEFDLEESILPMLEIISPFSAIENEMFTITVRREDTQEVVVGADVTFNGETNQTDADGQCIFIAPYVDTFSEEYSVTASMVGYQPDDTEITIYDRQLALSAQSSVVEGNDFTVTVTEEHTGDKVIGADVTFNGNTQQTDSSGDASFDAPYIDSDTNYSIEASLDDYQPATINIVVKDRWLVISTDRSVIEKERFNVTVTQEDTDQPVKDAMVTVEWGDESYTTDEDGMIINLTAPEVEEDTIFVITASMTGYQSATFEISVLNQEDVKGGEISGLVLRSDGSPISRAMVCVKRPGAATSLCGLTDDSGYYNLQVPLGTYNIEVSKPGFTPSIKYSLVIRADSPKIQNFALEKDQAAIDTTDRFVSHVVEEKIAAKILDVVMSIDPDKNTISLYSENLTIELNSTEGNITFTISAEDGTSGTVVLIRIGEGVLEDLDNLSVTYDGKNISEFTDIEEFFDIKGNPNLGWLRVLTKTGLYLFVRVPKFSEHTITITSISEIVEIVGGINAIILYIVIAIIVAVVFVGTGEINKRL